MFRIEADKSGRILRNPFYIRYDIKSKQLIIRYENKTTLPNDLKPMQCELQLVHENKTRLVTSQDLQVSAHPKNKRILIIKSTPNMFEEKQQTTKDKDSVKPLPTPTATPVAPKSIRIKSNKFNGHKATITFSYNGTARAIFTGVINTRSSTLDKITFEVPEVKPSED